MFCPNCGKMIPDNSQVCPECGASTLAQEAPAAQSAAPYGADPMAQSAAPYGADPMAQPGAVMDPSMQYGQFGMQPPKKKLPVAAIAAAAAVIVIVVIIVAVFSGGGKPEKVVEDYFQYAFEDPDGEKLLDLFPEKMIDAELDKQDMTRKELGKQAEQALALVSAFTSDISYDITGVEDADDDEIEEVSEECEEKYDFTVSDMKIITVEMHMTMEFMGESTDQDQDVEIKVIKVGRKWYLNPSDSGSFNSMF